MEEEKNAIIDRLAQKLEVITEDELRDRVSSGDTLTHYIGFEISGYVHIGTGIMSGLVMKDLADLGVKCTIWLADWHSAINQKLDGTKETAAQIGKGYFAEAMKASYEAVGGNPEDLDIRLASEWYDRDQASFWNTVVKVGQSTTLSRMLRSIDIMGRKEGEDVDYARTMYPAMQVADIFYQEIDIAHSGTDQRKAHVVMRDVADKIRPDRPKPIAIHQPLISSLTGKNKEDKMSKSDPNSAVFVHDTPEEIEEKMRKAFAPEKETEHNPVLNWTKNILFWSASQRTAKPFVIERKEEHGGTVEFTTFEELESAYASGDIHPMDLKGAVTQELIELLAPVREHFAKPEVAQKKEELAKILANR